MKTGFCRSIAAGLVLAAAGAGPLPADTTAWNGSSGEWADDARWDNGSPQDGDAVIIGSGTVLLAGASAALDSLAMSGGVLVFSNWTTRLSAVNITVTAGTLTLPPAFAESQMSNRVWIACSGGFTLGSNAVINVSSRGYSSQNGPGRGGVSGPYGSGGSYGGLGGISSQGGDLTSPTYGSFAAPLDPGSGGGVVSSNGGAGGGAVRIDAPDGAVTIFGTIVANGQTAAASTHAGGGSGGSIYITCRTLAGSSNGLLQAAGGGYSGAAYQGGGGGGGRIAVVYDPAFQGGVNPRIRMQTTYGPGRTNGGTDGYDGTLFLPDLAFCPAPLVSPVFSHVNLLVGGPTEWVLGSLTVSNAAVIFAGDGFRIAVSNDLIIGSGAAFGVGTHTTLECGGNLAVTNGGVLWVLSGPTNGIGPDYGALVAVTGQLSIATNSWIRPVSPPLDGGAALFRCGSLKIAAGGGFNADGFGFGRYRGYGRGLANYGGGSYGGRGGYSPISSSKTYGASNWPALPGSGGWEATKGGTGGGLIRIEAAGAVQLDGTLRANGSWGVSTHSGGGSGGGILVRARAFSGGASGAMQANGGTGVGAYGCGGGGGRIAVWRDVSDRIMQLYRTNGYAGMVVTNGLPTYLGSMTAAKGLKGGGSAVDGEDGTALFFTLAPGAQGAFVQLR